MNKKRLYSFFLFIILFGLRASAQVNPAIGGRPDNLKNLKIADTTAIKIKNLESRNKALEDDNKVLHEELATLKATLTALTTKVNELQKDNGAEKLPILGLNNTVGSIQTSLSTLQTSFTTFSTIGFLKHQHQIKGIAGNTIGTADNIVQLKQGQADLMQLEQSLRMTGTAHLVN